MHIDQICVEDELNLSIAITMNQNQSFINDCRRIYFTANRCWRFNNIKDGLELCNKLSKKLSNFKPDRETSSGFDNDNRDNVDLIRDQLAQLRQLVWFLKIKCLAEDYYINEAALFNDDDLDEDQEYDVRIISGSKLTSQRNNSKTSSTIRTGPGHAGPMGINGTQTGRVSAMSSQRPRPMTGMLTGRGQTGGFGLTSRQQSSRASTSYRPLTTGLTATQTAFSRSTRPLLKYSAQSLMAKLSFEYLYNAQTVTNKCPDYRQCLEFLNLVQTSVRKSSKKQTVKQIEHVGNVSSKLADTSSMVINVKTNQQQQQHLVDTRDDGDASSKNRSNTLGPYWLLYYGICYYNIKMNKQAEEYFEHLIEIIPKHLDAYLWLIKIYLRTNEPFKVLRICSIGLRHNKSALLYNWLARAQSIRGDLIGAHESLLESLRYFPTNVEALANAAYFAFYGDRQEQALKCFQRIEQLPQLQFQQTNSVHVTNDNLRSSAEFNASCSQLLNNIALCNFYCGNYHQIMPLFNQALLNSPNKEVTSDIWYNISFIPIHCGFNNLAISCLLLALQNNSQNEEALNNLGVLKYNNMFEDPIDFPSYIELKHQLGGSVKPGPELGGCENQNDFHAWTHECDQAEVYFNPSNNRSDEYAQPAESLFNMALIKLKRGHLLASARYCDLFSQQDASNYQISQVIREIKELVAHDF